MIRIQMVRIMALIAVSLAEGGYWWCYTLDFVVKIIYCSM